MARCPYCNGGPTQCPCGHVKREGPGTLVRIVVFAGSVLVITAIIQWYLNRPWQILAQYIAPGDIKMYSTDWCVPSQDARAHFEKFGIAYSDCDMEKDAQCRQAALALAQAEPGSPIFLVYGKYVVKGFGKDRLLKALQYE